MVEVERPAVELVQFGRHLLQHQPGLTRVVVQVVFPTLNLPPEHHQLPAVVDARVQGPLAAPQPRQHQLESVEIGIEIIVLLLLWSNAVVYFLIFFFITCHCIL